MRLENYKGEKYLDLAAPLFARLEALCEELISRLKSPQKSYPVADILKIKPRNFSSLWEHLPNTPDKKNSKNEFKGLYAFAVVEGDAVDFRYIGISQRTRARFTDHTKRNKSKDASWAYLMVKHAFPDLNRAAREALIADFQQEWIHPLRFTFCPIDDNMLMHLAEVYCVNRLRAKWNSFETH
jgi:hypothetical protein